MLTAQSVAAAFLFLLASQASAAVYDLAGDFSKSGNPDGAWSYGYSNGLAGSFVLESRSDSNKGVDYWKPRTGGTPFTSHNGTDAAVTIGTTTWQPGMVVSHAGPRGEFQINRLTVPEAGDYLLTASFLGVDSHGASADVHVLLNGVSVFSDVVTGKGTDSRVDVSLTRAIAADATVDFVVGTGDGNYLFDAVGMTAHVAAVPEPATYLMWGAGIVMLATRARRRLARPA